MRRVRSQAAWSHTGKAIPAGVLRSPCCRSPPAPTGVPGPPSLTLAGSRGAERPRLGCQNQHLPRSEWRRARGQGRFLWGTLQRPALKRFSLNRGVGFPPFAASLPDPRAELPPTLNSHEHMEVSLVLKASPNCDV